MRRRGFTLLEAVVALAIVGTVSIGALGAWATEARVAFRARESAPAAALARERLSRLELLDGPGLLLLPDSLSHGRLVTTVASYEWTARARRVRDELDLYEMTVEVRWADGAYVLAARGYRPPLASQASGGGP